MSSSKISLYSSNPKMYTYADTDGMDEFNSALASSEVYNYTRQEGSTYNRLGYGYDDYERQRPCEKIPTRHHDIMRESERVYEQIGLVRNMIDLMTDFTTQGIRIVHPSQHIEKLYKNWFKRVDGIDRSERFCSNLYKFGNVIVRRRWAKINKKDKSKLRNTRAAEDNIPLEHAKGKRRRIPSRYVFLNPSTVEIIGGEVANFVGRKSVKYAIRVPFSLKNKMTENDAVVKDLMSKLPQEMKNCFQHGAQDYIPLDSENLIVDHYKKEDWQLWGKPIMYGVFSDLRVLEKLKLADLTALDGAVDRVRIFKLGSLEHKLVPGAAAFSKLNELLRVNAGAGTRNIVWGPDLEMEESSSDVSTFLGEEKYRPTMSSIYGGLGIPPSLTGTNEVGGTTNNLVSLKALIKRLDYVRGKLVEFWEHEFELARQGLGMTSPAPTLEFDQNNLGDEEAEKKLFIEMADRDIIPYEAVHRKFGLDTDATSGKVEKEWKERNKDKRVEKAGPYHRTQFDDEIKKSLINRGKVTPSEVGIELDPRKPGDTTNLDPDPVAQEPPQKSDKPSPKKPTGRPPQSTDKAPRKKRSFVPVIKAQELWASEAQQKISEILNPVILSNTDKKNMRSLTAEETDYSEKMKFGVLFNLEPLSDVTVNSVLSACKQPFPQEEYASAQEYLQDVTDELGRTLTFSEKHNLYVEVYLGKN